FRRLFVKPSLLHFPENAFTLHLLLQNSESLVDVVVAYENLQRMFLSSVARDARPLPRQSRDNSEESKRQPVPGRCRTSVGSRAPRRRRAGCARVTRAPVKPHPGRAASQRLFLSFLPDGAAAAPAGWATAVAARGPRAWRLYRCVE